MVPTSRKRLGFQAFFACSFVFWFFGLGLANRVDASCGDYLKHSTSRLLGDSIGFSSTGFSANGLEDSPLPACECKNGSCRSAPASLPTESSRLLVLRKQLNQLDTSICVNGDSLQGALVASNELPPVQPSLDILVPPPRAACI